MRVVQPPLAAIYRLGSMPPFTAFIGELSSLWSVGATWITQSLITGDLNIHTENQRFSWTSSLRQTLLSCGLLQHVDWPAHRDGGWLDLVVTRDDCIMTNMTIDPLSVSDHGLHLSAAWRTVTYPCPDWTGISSKVVCMLVNSVI